MGRQKMRQNTPIRSSPCLQCLRKKVIEKKVNKKYAVNKIKPEGAKMPIRGTSLSFPIKDFLDFAENLKQSKEERLQHTWDV